MRTESIVKLLWSPSVRGEVFAVLDGARDESIVPALPGSPLEYKCLYDGPLAPELAAVAPYLVRLHPWSEFTSWLLEKAWGNSWGIFISTTQSLTELRRHLRRFLIVRDEEKRQLYFRYYDPRVMRLYLPTCTFEEKDYVFGAIDRYWMESEDGRALIEWSRLGPRSLGIER